MKRFFSVTFFAIFLIQPSLFSNCEPDCYCDCDFFYLGGGFNYVITNLPQNVVVNELEGFARNPLVFIGPQTQKSTRRRYRWNAYIGYEKLLTCNWRIGLELGYRDLGRLATEYTGEINSGNGISAAPFREVDSWAWDGLFFARYQFCCGLNFFAKFGAALVRMDLEEGNFIASRNANVSFTGPLSVYGYRYHNIYPELVLGTGYRFCDCVNLTVSYGHIFGPGSNSRFIQDFFGADDGDQRLGRPAQCPGFDYVTVNIEIPLNVRSICRNWF